MNQLVWKEIESSFKFIHRNLDKKGIKERLDRIGINSYINECAGLAAATGVASGLGGGATLALGIPADMANIILQQFKVTLAVIYAKTKSYKVKFKEFMRIVGISLGVEILFNLTSKIAQEIAKRLLVRGAGRLIPLVGGVIGGGINFAFIKSIGKTLKKYNKQKLLN